MKVDLGQSLPSPLEVPRLCGPEGNVGIGTTGPIAKFQVNGGTTADAVKIYNGQDDNTNAITAYNANGNVSHYWSTDASGNGAQVIKQNGGTAGVVLRSLGDSYFNSTGNVGIGSTGPMAKLDVNGYTRIDGQGDNVVIFGVKGSSLSNDILTLSQTTDGPGGTNAGTILLYSGNPSTLYTKLSPGVNYFNGGNVGIGTTGPGALLHVVKSGTEQAIIGEGGVNGLHIRGASGSGGTHYNWLIGEQVSVNKGFEITPSTAVGGTTFSTPALTILADTGNVGIGTTSPNIDSSHNDLALTIAQLSGNKIVSFEIGGTRSSSVGADAATARILFLNGTSTASTKQIASIEAHTPTPYDSNGGDLVFSTTGSGNTSVSERMRIVANGNVGIGTTGPLGVLNVQHAVGNVGVVVDATTNYGLTLWGSNNTGSIGFSASRTNVAYTARNTAAAWIEESAGKLDFYSDASLTSGNTYTPTSRMTILTTGNVGIGWTSPDSKMVIDYGILQDVSSTDIRTTTALELTADDPGTTSAAKGVSLTFRPIKNRGAAAAITAYNDGTNKEGNAYLAFSYGSGAYPTPMTEAMRITSGNVGIGTTGPGAILDVNGTARVRGTGSTTGLKVASDQTYPLNFHQEGGINYITTGSANSTTGSDLYIGTLHNNSAIVVSAANGGNVGIGTTSPGSLFTIKQGGTTAAGTPGTYGFQITDGSQTQYTAGYDGSYVYVQSWNSKPLRFNSQGNDVIFDNSNVSIGTTTRNNRLTVSGSVDISDNVGIGTTSPARTLDVWSAPSAGTAQVRGISNSGTNVSYGGLAVQATSGRGGYLTIGDASWTNTYYAHAGDVVLAATASAQIFLNTNATDNNGLMINTSGNVGIGTTSPDAKLRIKSGDILMDDGQAIRFGASDGDGIISRSSAKVLTIGGGSTTSTVFNVNGAEKMRIDTNGNVGIGTTGPGQVLDVVGTGRFSTALHVGTSTALDGDVTTAIGSPVLVQVGGSSSGNVLVENGNDTGGSRIVTLKTRSTGTDANTIVQSGDGIMKLRGYGADGAVYQPAAEISFFVDGTPGSSDMPGRISMFTTADGSTSLIERMTIKNDGNVGIGTTSPQFKFQVHGATNKNLGIDVLGTGQIGLQAANDANNSYVSFAINANDYSFNVASNPKMTIQNDGNVGIGTTGPATLVEVNASSSDANYGPTVNIRNPSTGPSARTSSLLLQEASGIFVVRAVGNGQTLRIGETTSTSNAPTDYMTIGGIGSNAQGNVGIGTTGPGTQLQVTNNQNAGTIVSITNTNTGASAYAGLQFGTTSAGNNTTYGLLHYTTSDNTLKLLAAAGATGGINIVHNGAYPIMFSPNQTEAMRITSTGNVGIGTTGPSDYLHVRTAANQRGIYIDGSSSSGAGDNLYLTMYNKAAGGAQWIVGSTGGTSGLGQGKLAFQVGTSETIIPLVLTSNGNVGTPQSRSCCRHCVPPPRRFSEPPFLQVRRQG